MGFCTMFLPGAPSGAVSSNPGLLSGKTRRGAGNDGRRHQLLKVLLSGRSRQRLSFICVQRWLATKRVRLRHPLRCLLHCPARKPREGLLFRTAANGAGHESIHSVEHPGNGREAANRSIAQRQCAAAGRARPRPSSPARPEARALLALERSSGLISRPRGKCSSEPNRRPATVARTTPSRRRCRPRAGPANPVAT